MLVLVWGGVLGLASGALYLNESVDKATAVGIAWFVTASVGMWIASYASLALMGSIRRSVESTLHRFEALQERTRSLDEQLGIQRPERTGKASWYVSWLVGFVVWLAPFSLGSFFFGLIAVGVFPRADLSFWLPAVVTLVGLGAFIVSAGPIVGFVWMGSRKINNLEEDVDLITEAIENGYFDQTRQIESSTERMIRGITRISGSKAEAA